ncbi:substrate-binding domain-containing protein [Teichococcus aestuarii]
MPEFLTLKEAARLLRLSERALYDLARQQRLPAVILAGKWIFPRDLLLRWMSRAAGPEAARLAPPAILAGSHDPLLDWAVRQSGCGPAIAAGGSLMGLETLAAGRALAAATHLPDPDGGAFNEATVRDLLPDAQAVGLVWAWREQGLILPAGNPQAVRGIADLARPGLRVAGRQPRAGSHLLLLHLLAEAQIRLDPPLPGRARHGGGRGGRRRGRGPCRGRLRHPCRGGGARAALPAADPRALRPRGAGAGLVRAGAAGAAPLHPHARLRGAGGAAERLRHRRLRQRGLPGLEQIASRLLRLIA